MGDDAAEFLGPARLAFFTPVREYPPLADRKAASLLTANGLLGTVAFFFDGPIGGIVDGDNVMIAWGASITLLVLRLSLLAGAWLALEALALPIPPMPDSLAFYPHIARLTPDEYRARVLAVDYAGGIRDMLHYNYSLADQANRRFRIVGRSIHCLEIAFATWAIMMAMVVLTSR